LYDLCFAAFVLCVRLKIINNNYNKATFRLMLAFQS
jgi:hypothetical protein